MAPLALSLIFFWDCVAGVTYPPSVTSTRAGLSDDSFEDSVGLVVDVVPGGGELRTLFCCAVRGFGFGLEVVGLVSFGVLGEYLEPTDPVLLEARGTRTFLFVGRAAGDSVIDWLNAEDLDAIDLLPFDERRGLLVHTTGVVGDDTLCCFLGAVFPNGDEDTIEFFWQTFDDR